MISKTQFDVRIAAIWPCTLQGCLASTPNGLSSIPTHKFLATTLQ